jgi:hypothetical protein
VWVDDETTDPNDPFSEDTGCCSFEEMQFGDPTKCNS